MKGTQTTNVVDSFSFLVPSEHVHYIIESRKKLKKKTKCHITVEQETGTGSRKVNVAAPNPNKLSSTCWKILQILFLSQLKPGREISDKNCINILLTYTYREALELFQNFGVTFKFRDEGVAVMRAWDENKLLEACQSILSAAYEEQDRVLIEPKYDSEAKNETDDVTIDCSSFPKVMNILVLGETGVGKSTFINSIFNYMKFESLDDALFGNPEILIESEFQIRDQQRRSHKVHVRPSKPTEEENNENSRSTEVIKTGQSATRFPHSYSFNYQHNGEEQTIRIIDTPGMGDTRGVEEDKKNFDNILKFIASYEEIHAICILLKPNSSRATATFQFCINELLANLHRDASRNILFCFTMTRGNFYQPGDTYATLEEHLNILEAKRNIAIPLEDDTVFCFDNESFRMLCALRQGIYFNENEKASFDASWKVSVDETVRLFKRISELPVHNTTSTLCLNTSRRLIVALAVPLSNFVNDILENNRKLEIQATELLELEGKSGLLKDKLYVEKTVTDIEKTEFPMTVCTSFDCVDIKPLGDKFSSGQDIVYKTVCHNPCKMTRLVKDNIVSSGFLYFCSGMTGWVNPVCKKCECSWKKHKHIRYICKKRIEKTIDKDIEKRLQKSGDEAEVKKEFIKTLTSKILKNEAESGTIMLILARFASFLEANAIIPYNDSFSEYLDHLIENEKYKVSQSGDPYMVSKLKNYKKKYQCEVELLKENIKKKSEVVCSVEEVNDWITVLKAIPDCGTIIEKYQNVDKQINEEAQLETDTHVTLLNRLIGRDPTKKEKPSPEGRQSNWGGTLTAIGNSLPSYGSSRAFNSYPL